MERKLQIIGEALSQLAKARPELAARVRHVPQIVAFRNKRIHGYARVDHATVWEVIEQSLPSLGAVVDALLQELEQN